jgi:hypothetical protein
MPGEIMKLRAVLATLILSTSALASTYVQGYTRRDGTYVAPHYRSDPNNTINDNWSTQGNTNPYTGESGRKKPDLFQPSYGNNYNNLNKQNSDDN